MVNTFFVDGTEFTTNTDRVDNFTIKSHPANYDVVFESFQNKFSEDQVVLIDKKVKGLY